MSGLELSLPSSEDYFFEGAEKLLEIWFASSLDQESNSGSNVIASQPDLRRIPRSALESLLKLVKCEIISYQKHDQIDAYVLSESSMFISRDRLILKTCGSTSLLNCIEPVIYLAKEVAGFDEVVDVFFSRKNFLRPDLQSDPHRSFEIETELLDSYFDEGAAYCMGRMNNDHWFLYTLAPADGGPHRKKAADQTLEILMQDLDPERMRIFTRAVCSSGKQATEMSGIDKLIPGVMIDDFLFDPCGYSMNGVIRGGYYMTIHITPESEFSYVSFETNWPASSYSDLISKVIQTFRPGNFMVTLMASSSTSEGLVPSLKRKDFQSETFGAFKMKELQHTQINNDYLLSFVSFVKFPS